MEKGAQPVRQLNLKTCSIIGGAILLAAPMFVEMGNSFRKNAPERLTAAVTDRIVQAFKSLAKPLNKSEVKPAAINSLEGVAKPGATAQRRAEGEIDSIQNRPSPQTGPAIGTPIFTIAKINPPSAKPGNEMRSQPTDKTDDESRFQPIILKAARKYKIDPALIKAIIKVESGFDPWAVSKRGAMGLMQLMPRTAESLGVKKGFDPEHNILGGVKYFKQLLHRFNDNIHLALAAYNAGSKTVLTHKGVPPFKSTRHYLYKVLKQYHQYKLRMHSG